WAAVMGVIAKKPVANVLGTVCLDVAVLLDVQTLLGVAPIATLSVFCDAGVRIRQHAAAIGEVENVTILAGILDVAPGCPDLVAQPALEVSDIQFDDIHDPGNRTIVAAWIIGAVCGVAAVQAFAGIVEVDWIPVVLGSGAGNISSSQCMAEVG